MGTDQLFLIAEKLSKDFSLFPQIQNGTVHATARLEGVLAQAQISDEISKLKQLDIDSYIEKTVSPTEDKNRPGAKALLKKLGLRVIREYGSGPLYGQEAEMDYANEFSRI